MNSGTVCAFIAATAVAVSAFLITQWLFAARHRAGRRAYQNGEPLDAKWPEEKRDGWAAEWGEHIHATLGYRGRR